MPVMDRNSRPMTAVLALMTMGVQLMPKTIIKAAASTPT
jgi:spore maturation protein SpmA